jgi:hypothetical protein
MGRAPNDFDGYYDFDYYDYDHYDYDYDYHDYHDFNSASRHAAEPDGGRYQRLLAECQIVLECPPKQFLRLVLLLPPVPDRKVN